MIVTARTLVMRRIGELLREREILEAHATSNAEWLDQDQDAAHVHFAAAHRDALNVPQRQPTVPTPVEVEVPTPATILEPSAPDPERLITSDDPMPDLPPKFNKGKRRTA